MLVDKRPIVPQMTEMDNLHYILQSADTALKPPEDGEHDIHADDSMLRYVTLCRSNLARGEMMQE